MATTVPMLAPDGTSGDIPQERVQDALKAGFKPAVVMTSPDGKLGYIPQERQQDAVSAGFKLASPSLDLSNRQGQGTYQMAGPDGKTVPVPYGQVQTAAQQGYKFASDKDLQTYNKDHSYATTGPGHEAEYAQSDRNAPALTRVVSGVVKGIGSMAKPVLDVAGAATGVPQQAIDASLQGQSGLETAAKVGTMGAVAAPAAVAAPLTTAGAALGGTVGAGAGNYLARATGMGDRGTALLTDAGGLAGGTAGGMGGNSLSNAIAGARTSPWAEAAAQDVPWLRLAARIGPTGSSQKTLGVVPALADDLKAIVPQMGITRARGPMEFSKAAEAFLNGTAKPAYRGIADNIGGETIGPGRLPDNVKQFKLSDGTELGPNPTIARAEQALSEANQLAGPGYEGATNSYDRQAIMNAKTNALQLRRALNNRIGELTGLEPELVGALRERIGQAGNIAGNARERSLANNLGIDSAPAVAMKAGMARSMPARAIRAALVEPLENWQFRRALNAAQNAPMTIDPNSQLGILLRLSQRQ